MTELPLHLSSLELLEDALRRGGTDSCGARVHCIDQCVERAHAAGGLDADTGRDRLPYQAQVLNRGARWSEAGRGLDEVGACLLAEAATE